MNKRFLILIALTVICSGASAQWKQGHAATPISHNLGKETVVDQTRLRVWFALNADSIGNPDTYIDLERLDVGDSISKFYSWFLSNSDSLRADYGKRNPRAQSAPLWLGPGGKNSTRWMPYEYADLYITGGTLTEYACMPCYLHRYNGWYEEPYPQQQWTMESRFQTILGYDCQRATCHWRGRDYVVWFAPEIPVRMGPWKLGGLPGLILKAEVMPVPGEPAGVPLYTFEAVRIEKRRFPITRFEYEGYKKTSRAELQKNQKTFAENWFKAVDFHKGTILPDGNMEMGEALSIHTDFYPLEIE